MIECYNTRELSCVYLLEISLLQRRPRVLDDLFVCSFFIETGLSQSIPNEVAKWFHGGSQRVCEGNRSARDIGGRSASISEEQRGQ